MLVLRPQQMPATSNFERLQNLNRGAFNRATELATKGNVICALNLAFGIYNVAKDLKRRKSSKTSSQGAAKGCNGFGSGVSAKLRNFFQKSSNAKNKKEDIKNKEGNDKANKAGNNEAKIEKCYRNGKRYLKVYGQEVVVYKSPLDAAKSNAKGILAITDVGAEQIYGIRF